MTNYSRADRDPDPLFDGDPTEPPTKPKAELTPEARRALNHFSAICLITAQNFGLVNVIAHTIQPIQPGWLITFTIMTAFLTGLLYRRVTR